MAQVFKIKYQDTLRRLSLPPRYDESAAGLTFQDLQAKIRELFRISPTSELVITYADTENDVVTIADDQDLIDACVVQRLNPLRLEVTIKGEGATAGGGEGAGAPPTAQTPKDNSAGPSAPQVPYFGGDFSVESFLKGVLPDATLDSIRQILSRYPPVLEAAVPAGVLPEALEAFLKTLTRPVGATTQPGSQPDPIPRAAHFNPPSFKQPFDESGAEGPFFPRGRGGKGDAPARIFHRGVQCDGCGMTPIEGPRYKSMKQPDYDLCSSCFTEIGNETDYHKMDRPMQFRRNHCPYSPWGGPRIMRHPMGPPPFRPFFAGSRKDHLGRHYSRYANATGEHAGGKLNARFVQDVTIFDGTELAPGTKFTKIWRLSNNGTLPWPQNTQLVHIGGDVLCSDEAVTLELPEGGLPFGKEIEASVDLVAPESAGRHVSHWRLMTPSGQRFGHRVWVLIQVVPKGEESPQMQESLSEEELMNAAGEPVGTAKDTNATDTSMAVEDSMLKVAKASETAGRQVEEQQAEKMLSGDVSDVVMGELGGFSMVEKPVEDISYPPIEDENVVNEEVMMVAPEEIPASELGAVMDKGDSDILLEALLEKLATMGFTERDLNIELLGKNKNDLQLTIDDLVAAAGWDQMLNDLQEMGFNDTQINRRLLLKNEGSIKRVVKELVEMEKQQMRVGKGKEKAY